MKLVLPQYGAAGKESIKKKRDKNQEDYWAEPSYHVMERYPGKKSNKKKEQHEYGKAQPGFIEEKLDHQDEDQGDFYPRVHSVYNRIAGHVLSDSYVFEQVQDNPPGCSSSRFFRIRPE